MRNGRKALVPATLTVICVLTLIAVTTAATSPVPGVVFAQSGHWAVDKVQRTVLHIHGDTASVDARVTLPDDAAQGAVMALQGATQGFVVGRDRAWSFDKSALQTTSSIPLPAAAEKPVGIETPGGPYLVYRTKGTIVRLGQPTAVVEAGGPLDAPIRTSDGTVWVHRPDNGTLCAFRPDAVQLDCDAHVASGSPGGLTVVGDRAAFVDTSADVAHLVRPGDQDGGAPLGSDLPAATLLPDQATAARLPVVVPGDNRLRLLDATGIREDKAPGAPLDVALGVGTFSAPMVSGDIIAVLELGGSTLTTFDATGRRIADLRLPPGTDPADAHRGEDGRIYVDEPNGARTDIVRSDGTISPLDLGLGSTDRVAGAASASLLKPVAPPPPGQLVIPRASPETTAAPAGNTGPVLGSGLGGGGAAGGTGGGLGHGGYTPPPPTTTTEPPAERPAPPVNVVAALGRPGDVIVTWADGEGGGPATSYTVTSSGQQSMTTSTGKATFTGLAQGTYTFTVTATNQAGTSDPPAPSNPVTVPPADVTLRPPSDLKVTFAATGTDGSGIATLTWTPPVLPGGTPVRYQTQVLPTGTTKTVSGTSVQFTSKAEFDACAKTTFSVTTVASGRTSDPVVEADLLVPQCPPIPVEPSKLLLSPVSGTVTTGNTIAVTVSVRIGSQPVNAVQANLSFPSGVLNCDSITINSSQWPVTAQKNCSASQVQIGVGRFNPPLSMGTVAVATVTFKAVGPGPAPVTFDSGSDVAAGDGNGTSVLGPTSGGTYTVTQ